MKTLSRQAVILALAALAVGAALAQTAGEPGAPPAPRVQSAGGVDYVSGGAGDEERAAMAQLRPEFALRIVFSDSTGAYVVADRVEVRGASGTVLAVTTAGPMLFLKLGPGRYTIEASIAGRMDRRSVELGREPRTLEWRWPAA